jgi:hypothetical protein
MFWGLAGAYPGDGILISLVNIRLGLKLHWTTNLVPYYFVVFIYGRKKLQSTTQGLTL